MTTRERFVTSLMGLRTSSSRVKSDMIEDIGTGRLSSPWVMVPATDGLVIIVPMRVGGKKSNEFISRLDD